jgi:hypothetical protein
MNWIQKTALAYLAFVGVLAWGVAIGQYKVLPYSIIREVVLFARGAVFEETNIIEKFLSDADVKPHRLIRNYPTAALQGFEELNVDGLRARRERPRFRLSDNAPRGYRVVFETLDLDETFWGALLIDPDGRLVHQCSLSTDDMPRNTDPAHRKNMNGIGILPDGSVIFSMQEKGGGIVKVDYCSKRVWGIDGNFHHAVSFTNDDTFWTLGGKQSDFDPVLTLIDVATGRVVKKIDMKDVRAANPSIRIFDLQSEEEIPEAVHSNSIDPLPRALLKDFPQVEHGDVLVSYHTTNLLFIVDPDTLEIKWWRVGPWDRQHDPDWN